MRVTVNPRSARPSKRFPLTVNLDGAKPTVASLKSAIALQAKVSSPPLAHSAQRFMHSAD